ncbi:MAG: acyl carrier protein [Anaerolineales bacterium]|nr:acyl carrier protein [Anaerolineales bacterium]
MTTYDTTRDTLKEFILNRLIRNPKLKLNDTDSLIKGGYIDSFALVEVQLFIEEQFGFRPADIDMTVESMDTLKQMAEYVEANRTH